LNFRVIICPIDGLLVVAGCRFVLLSIVLPALKLNGKARWNATILRENPCGRRPSLRIVGRTFVTPTVMHKHGPSRWNRKNARMLGENRNSNPVGSAYIFALSLPIVFGLWQLE
jgi:hypothetical protein